MVMSHRNFVFGNDCKELLTEAVQKHLPVKVTNQQDNRWQVYKSNFLALQDQQLILALPTPDMSDSQMEPVPGQDIAVTFKKGYHKCLFTSRVIKRGRFELEAGVFAEALTIAAPQQLEKIQRRAFNRTEAPAGESITVEFCAIHGSISRSYVIGKKWEGALQDISAGGLGITLPKTQMPSIEAGEQFEASFIPLPQQNPLILQVRFRHTTDISGTDRVMMGFQLVGMEMSEYGREMLRRIGRIVNVYQRQRKLVAPLSVGE